MPVDDTVAAQLNTQAAVAAQQLGNAAARGIVRQSDLADETGRILGNHFGYDMRLLSGVLTDELIGENERANVAGLNTAVRTPSTIDHYSLGAGPAAPGAPAGAATAPVAK